MKEFDKPVRQPAWRRAVVSSGLAGPVAGMNGSEGQQAAATWRGVPEPVTVRWHQPEGLYGLSLLNALLTFLTLGLYLPWAKTEVRRRLWRAVEINGQRLEYTGQGLQLFLGLLIVGSVLVLLTGLYYAVGFYLLLPADRNITDQDVEEVSTLLGLFLLPIVAFLWGVARHRALRYRLRHTLWRGIRGGMAGSALRHGWRHLWTYLPVFLSLGLLVPWRAVHLRNALFSDMRFGSGRFLCRAQWLRLMPAWLMVWGSAALLVLYGLAHAYMIAVAADPYVHNAVFMAASLWLISLPGWVPWALFGVAVYAFLRYEAGKLNAIARGMRFREVQFSLDMTVDSLLRMLLRNALLLFVSFGLFRPVVLANIAGHLVGHLKVHGALDVASLTQAAEEGEERAGEGLASFLDIDGV